MSVVVSSRELDEDSSELELEEAISDDELSVDKDSDVDSPLELLDDADPL